MARQLVMVSMGRDFGEADSFSELTFHEGRHQKLGDGGIVSIVLSSCSTALLPHLTESRTRLHPPSASPSLTVLSRGPDVCRRTAPFP